MTFDEVLLTCINAACPGGDYHGATPKTTARPNREVRFSDVKLKTGVRLRYAEQGNPKGQAVILLHGYSDSWFSYSRILPLINKKYHVYVPDRRGHGDSERPVSGYTFPDFAADVLAFMDAKGLKQADTTARTHCRCRPLRGL